MNALLLVLKNDDVMCCSPVKYHCIAVGAKVRRFFQLALNARNFVLLKAEN